MKMYKYGKQIIKLSSENKFMAFLLPALFKKYNNNECET